MYAHIHIHNVNSYIRACIHTYTQTPHFVKDFVVTERVQKYFTKNLKGLRDKPYKERLSSLKLPTLECRRAYNDLIFYIKLFMDFLTPLS